MTGSPKISDQLLKKPRLPTPDFSIFLAAQNLFKVLAEDAMDASDTQQSQGKDQDQSDSKSQGPLSQQTSPADVSNLLSTFGKLIPGVSYPLDPELQAVQDMLYSQLQQQQLLAASSVTTSNLMSEN